MGFLGGGGGGGSSAPQNVTQTSVTEPPDYVRAFGPQLMQRASALSQVPFSEYGGERVAPPTPFHQAGMDLATSRALFGDPAVEAGRGMLEQTLRGDFTANPLLNASWNRAADVVQSRLASSVLPHQGLSNTGYAEAMQRQMNDLAAAVYGQERSNQMAAAPMALQYGQEPYEAAQAVMGVGDVAREYDQARINEAIRAFEAQRLYPYQQLDVLGRGFQMGMGGGGTTVTTQPGYFQPSRVGNILGGGLLGYGLGGAAPQGSFFQQNPLLGALGGGLLGGFF